MMKFEYESEKDILKRVGVVANIMLEIGSDIDTLKDRLKELEMSSDDISQKMNDIEEQKGICQELEELEQIYLDDYYHKMVEYENQIKYLEKLKNIYANELLNFGELKAHMKGEL